MKKMGKARSLKSVIIEGENGLCKALLRGSTCVTITISMFSGNTLKLFMRTW